MWLNKKGTRSPSAFANFLSLFPTLADLLDESSENSSLGSD